MGRTRPPGSSRAGRSRRPGRGGRRQSRGPDSELLVRRHRDARDRCDRGDLVVVFAGLRSTRGDRPVQPDPTEGVDRCGRVPLQRPGARPRGHRAIGDWGALRPTKSDPRRLRRSAMAPRRRSDDLVVRSRGRLGSGAPIRATPLRPPPVHHVLLRNHRSPEEHRSRFRRNAPETPLGASAPLRRSPGRRRLLVQHVRVDDVELARYRARFSCDDRRLRRKPCSSRPSCALAPRGGSGHHSLRNEPEVPVRERQRRGHPSPERRSLGDALAWFDGHATQPGAVRLGVRERQTRHPTRIDLRRHRHHRMLRSRGPDPAGPAWTASGAGARHGSRVVGRRRCRPRRPQR